MATDAKLFQNDLEQLQNISIRYDEPMALHTTFHIGGPADFYVEPQSADALRRVLRLTKKHNVKTQVIGRGSNILIADAGFHGVIVSTSSMKQITVLENVITAEAGATLTALAKTACDHALTGLQFSNGIPGSVGGAVFMNAGAYDGEISEVLTESTYYDRESGEVISLSGDGHRFDYRNSIYRTHPEWIILSARFALLPGDENAIRREMEELMRRRIEKQPLEYPSAGSTFKRYPGRYTAKMIDEAGLKGCTVGGAQVSEKHAGFIINRGGATAGDVLSLIDKIQKEIYRLHKIEIEPEVIYIPE
ncbi:MAG: UDP-N-acetylmuramate dehydrogenase [Clostridia bacterium]|nr:UDP-N-acetylmuramate dehydrogenase [Clostridia bacterium]